MTGRERRRIAALLVLAALAAGAVALLVQRSPRAPSPVEPVWDRTACARCRMLVGDPHWAAQWHTPQGDVLHFDDPGCLLLDLAEGGETGGTLFFHHHEEERWLAGGDAAFVPAGPTPMGYGLGAADAGTEGALGIDEATRRVRELEAAGERR